MPQSPALAWSSPPDSRDYRTTLGRWALSFTDAALAGVVIVVPLFFGGRHDLGRLLFVALTGVAAAAWCVYQSTRAQPRWRGSLTHLIAPAAVLMLLLQCTALPEGMAEHLSWGRTAELPLWSESGLDGVRLGTWQTASLAPAETRLALAVLIAYGLLFVTVHQRLETIDDVRWLINLVAGATVGTALFGLIHTPLSNGLYYWSYDLPYCNPQRAFCGGFTNRNHFAHFLVLGLGPLVAWLVLREGSESAASHQAPGNRLQSERPSLAVMLGAAALATVVLTVLLTCSRGGAIALATSLAVLLGLFQRASLISTRHFTAAAALAVVVLGVLSLYGYDKVSARLETILTGDMQQADPLSSRQKIWRANAAAFQGNWLTGTGAGTHRQANPLYLTEHTPRVYTHAENSYLQVLSENGVAGGVLMLLAVGACVANTVTAVRRAPSRRAAAYAAAAAAGLAASLAHSLVDFVWFIPALMAVTLMLAACQLRLAQLANETSQKQQPTPVQPKLWWGAAAGTSLVAAWAITTYAGPGLGAVHWDRFLRARIANQHFIHAQLNSDTPQQGFVESRLANTRVMIGHLEAYTRGCPDSAEAHLQLANRLVEHFDLAQLESENAMLAEHLRDTVASGGFDSPQQVREWLSRAVGENTELLERARRHALASIALCPLTAEPYLRLAETDFLVGQPPATSAALLKQAAAVRPHDPSVLYSVGASLLAAGDHQQAEAFWKRSYACEGAHRLTIIRRLAPVTPASYFTETYRPTWGSLEHVWRFYRPTQTAEELHRLVEYAEEAARQEPPGDSPAREGKKWVLLSQMQDELGLHQQAAESLATGYQKAPTEWRVRRQLGLRLAGLEKHQQAEPHLRWSLGRFPQDKPVRRALVDGAKHRLQARRYDQQTLKR